MNKLLAIVGPTGVGKTKLALTIKKELDSRLRGNDKKKNWDNNSVGTRHGEPLQTELVSVDSRQVYIGMDIGTGKDTKIFGTDLVLPDKLFSVADFCRVVKPHIEKLWRQNKLPILIGGTGLYLKALIDGIETINIPPNKNLRSKLGKLSVTDLQNKLLSMYGYIHDNREKGREALKINNSDWNNPRRLIRKIEIISVGARHGEPHGVHNCEPLQQLNKLLIIGLTASLPQIQANIEKRVKDRLDQGILNEIAKLVEIYGWNIVLRNTIAYQEWEDYFAGKITKEGTIAKWIHDEFDYAKRQLTWFKKDKRVIWLENNYLQQTLNLIRQKITSGFQPSAKIRGTF